MKAWKIVVDGESTWTYHSDDSANSVYESPFRLYYKIGQTTYPNIGKIFVFKDFANAISFIYFCAMQNLDTLRIFYGEAENARVCKYISMKCRIRNISAFWKLKKRKKAVRYNLDCSKAPVGTYVCSSFTPEKEYMFYQLVKLSKGEHV